MYGYVYRVTLPNKYSYIGSHQSETFDEYYWGSSENYKYWKALFLAGKENVKREILCWCETYEELIKAEYQAMLDNNEYLYNLSKPKIKNEKTKKIICKVCPICNKEFEVTPRQCRQKYCCSACASRASRKGLTTQKCWNKGLTKETDERVKRIGNKLKGKPTWSKGLKLKNRKRP